jgi:hypothetical protein
MLSLKIPLNIIGGNDDLHVAKAATAFQVFHDDQGAQYQ